MKDGLLLAKSVRRFQLESFKPSTISVILTPDDVLPKRRNFFPFWFFSVLALSFLIKRFDRQSYLDNVC